MPFSLTNAPASSKLMPTIASTIISTFSALFTLTTSSSTPTPSKSLSPTFVKSSHASASMAYHANERNMRSISPQYPSLALSFHPQAFPWTLTVSPPLLSGWCPKTFMTFKFFLASPTSTADSLTAFHALFLTLRTFFERANDFIGSIKPNLPSIN